MGREEVRDGSLGQASIGAATKPMTIFLVVHWPSPSAYGLKTLAACYDTNQLPNVFDVRPSPYTNGNE